MDRLTHPGPPVPHTIPRVTRVRTARLLGARLYPLPETRAQHRSCSQSVLHVELLELSQAESLLPGSHMPSPLNLSQDCPSERN